MNHESHIILMCKGLSEVRATTDVAAFLDRLQEPVGVSPHNLLKKYMDAETATLTTRAEFVQYILQTWERKVSDKVGDPAKKYCYCKDIQSGRMVQCDGCQDWFHYTCAGLPDNFSSLDDWYCENCLSTTTTPSVCICGGQEDPNRETLVCRGICEGLFHPECLGVNIDRLRK